MPLHTEITQAEAIAALREVIQRISEGYRLPEQDLRATAEALTHALPRFDPKAQKAVSFALRQVQIARRGAGQWPSNADLRKAKAMIDDLDYKPNRALARAKLETIAWEQTPEGRRGKSGSRREVLLDTTEGTGMVPLTELTDFQLRRYIGSDALQEAGDMRKNGKGIYSGTAAQEDDYVIWRHGTSGLYHVDRVGRSGKSVRSIGKPASSLKTAVAEVRKEALRRGYTSGLIFEMRPGEDDLRQIGQVKRGTGMDFESNARRPESTLGLHEDLDLLRQFVEMAAESMELENYKDAEVTPELIRVATEYDAALRWTLDEVVMRFPPKNGASADDLWSANASYLVLMTLRGEGVGIWDGDWEDFYPDTDKVQAFFERKLGLYADSSGSGKLNEAFMNAASETCGDPDYSPNASTSRRREEPDENAARELSLYIENEYSLVGAPNSQGKSIEKNLLRKMKAGTFDLARSEQAWMYLIETGAKKYAKEFADAKDWNKIFNKPTRELVAHEFATTFYEEAKLGNLG